ncbi:MAG: ABC transporter permease [Sedimentitalea sp.]
MRSVLPILSVVAAIVAFWYAAVLPMNIHAAATQAEREGVAVFPDSAIARKDVNGIVLVARNPHVIGGVFAQKRPRLPAPHEVAIELWETTVEKKITSKRSLIYHGWVTVSATLLGFGIGTGLGILLAIGIVYSRAMDMSVMPWAIASQTIPILAVAPMIIVVLGALGVQGLLPKALIAAYLSFFPVVVGMVKGFRSPDAMQLDLLKTYGASGAQGFWKLRLPASMPYLFASLKIGIAASLVGTIVGELPTGAQAGFGARMLVGDQYGQPLVAWAALFAAAIAAAGLVGIVAIIERVALARMGMRAS